jgi:hypothetical protein
VIGVGNSTSAFLSTDQVNVLDPMLAPLSNYGGPTLTHALLFGSPAFNGGDPGYDHVPDSDARSGDDFISPRTLLGRVDVGAIEHVLAPAQIVVDSTDDSFDADFGPGQLTLREAIALANYFPGSDHIAFAPSLGAATILLDEGQLVITDSVEIRGPDGATVVIDAGQRSRAFLIDDRTNGTINVHMEWVTIQGGDAHDNPAVGAFVYTATPETIDGITSTLDSPLLNDNIDALFHITHNFNPASTGGTYFDAPASIYFDGTSGHWNIVQFFHGPFEPNASFNVYVPKGNDVAYRHRVTTDNQGVNYTVLDHPSLNGNPSATVLVSHLANTSGGIGAQETFGVWYNTTTSRWNIYNQDLSAIPVGWNFSVIIPAATSDNARFVHHASAANINSNWTVIDNPASNNNPNAILHVTPIYSKHYVGVWYNALTGRWNIYNEDLAAMTPGDAFHVYIDHVGEPDARGGAILSQENLSIDTAILRNNTGSSGGAIYQQGARLEITESWIRGNEASEGHGGGIVVFRSNTEINRSTISDNVAEGSGAVGGGMFIDNHPDLTTSSTHVLNSTVSSNRAASNGGGIHNTNGLTSIRSSTIAYNQAGLNIGSGLFTHSGPTVRTQLTHTMVTDNLGIDVAVGPGATPSIRSLGYNLFGEFTGPIELQTSDAANVANSGLLPLTNNGGPTPTHALHRNSPALNGGTMNAAELPATDQRGETRLALGRADIGAYERQTAPLRGDFNDDGRYSCEDIDTLMAGIATGDASTLLDMNLDGRLDLRDRDAWLSQAGGANLGPGRSFLPGDANLDGAVDGTDLAIWNDHRFTNDTRWCHGNFNGDTVVDVSDFSLWFQHRFTTSAPAAAAPTRRSHFAPLAASITRRQK